MEDDLNIFENVRRPQLFLKMEDDLIFLGNEGNQKNLINGKQPQFF